MQQACAADHRSSANKRLTCVDAWASLWSRHPDRCRCLAEEDHHQGGAPAAQRGRTTLMVIFRGERLPGDRRTARPSVQAQRRGTVASGTRLHACSGAGDRAAAPATGGLPPIGRGQAAAPKSPSSPAAPGSSRRIPSRRLADSRSARNAIPRGIGEGRNSPARP